MKKIFIISILFVVLWSCSIGWNREKDEKIAELQKQVEILENEKENDLFEKKKECSTYHDSMLKYAKEFRSEIYEINEIFYSPKLNSCLFLWDSWDYEFLFDYFNRVNIDTLDYLNSKKSLEWENKIKELKWE